MHDSLQELGWDESHAEAFAPHAARGLVPARVARQERGLLTLLTADGELAGQPVGSLPDYPVVGDWVAAELLPAERRALVRGVLPRRSRFSRKEPWLRTQEQVLAANVDTVFLVGACGRDFNVRRLERYLTAAWDSGADPVLVLTKADLAEDLAATIAEAEAIAFGVPVHAVSGVTGDGVEALDPYLGPGRTVALLGSSGVGKSTLANRLLGAETFATAPIRGDGRGRHTTTHRELVRLPGGALLVDTPGLRELQLWSDEASLEGTFADVAELAERCRFSDCSHEREPGCAVQAALGSGELSPARWESYAKLRRELRMLALRQDARLRAEERKERRRFERSLRRTKW